MLRLPWTHAHLSVMSAITEHCHLLSRTWTGAMHGTRVVAFLQHRLRRGPGKLRVIWDGALIHRCRAVKQFLAEGAAHRLKLLALPGDAPDLNPDAGVWRWRKRVALGTGGCATRDELRYGTATGLRPAAAAQGRVRSMQP